MFLLDLGIRIMFVPKNEFEMFPFFFTFIDFV